MTDDAACRRLPALRILDYLDVLFSLFMVCLLLRLWIWPQHSDVESIAFIGTLLGFEFIMVHSGVFMSFVPMRYSLLFFFPAYGLFAWAFSAMAEDGGTIMFIYLLAVFNRMRFAFFTSDSSLKVRTFKAAFIRGFVYFFTVMPTAFFLCYLFPRLGLTKAFLAESGYYETGGGGFLFDQGPHVTMGFGVLYYCALACFDFWLARHPKKLREPL